MEKPEKLRLDIFNKIHSRQMEFDSSSSDSEQEMGSESSFGTPRSGTSDIGTPRSITSDESSAVTSPRANLLWDHGFDVAKGERKSIDGRDAEWRRFSNKTDDDKIIADKRMKIQEIAHKVQEINESEPKQVDEKHNAGVTLPDLIPAASVLSSVRSSQESLYAIEDNDNPPPLPDSDPPNIIDIIESPPPLPATSPPHCLTKNDPSQIGESIELIEYENNMCENNNNENEDRDSDDTNKLCNENPLGHDTQSDDSSSAAGDLSDQESDEITNNFDGFYNVQSHTLYQMEADAKDTKLPIELTDDCMEAEFDFILESLHEDRELQETYMERFSNRRDRYGFILSPVIEAPSPTLSNMSGYSGYSGISCSSPDPLGAFRMSPGPNRGSKQEIDLSSLCVNTNDRGNEQTVPIYQTVLAKRALVVPEGYGWDSGDDLLSPTGSGEWDCSDNGLSTPPVSTSSVFLTQFGTHVSGWKQPDVAIYEEPEIYDTDSTVEDENDSDTDTTIDEDSPRKAYLSDTSNVVVTECESPEKNIYLNENSNYSDTENDETRVSVHVIDESIQTLELSVLEEGINEVENELKLLKVHTGRSDDLIQNGEQELNEIKVNVTNKMNENNNEADPDTVVNDRSLDESFRGLNSEKVNINQSTDSEVECQKTATDEETMTVNRGLEKICRKPIPVQRKYAHSTSGDESESTNGSEDAEDEYSDSESEKDEEENKESDFELFNARPLENNEKPNVADEDLLNKDGVFVTELLSPRSAILKSGGMFPQETDSSSDDDVPDANMSSYGSGIKISQYTSGDSDNNDSPNNSAGLSKQDNETTKREQDKPVMNHTELVQRKEVPDKEENVNPITIHNQLDFSILDTRLEGANRGELRKSPRIFGRYYAEMDDELLEEVRSKCDSIDTPRSEQELQDTLSENSNQRMNSCNLKMSTDIEDFDSSFQQVEISYLSDVNLKQISEEQKDSKCYVKQKTVEHDLSTDDKRDIENKKEETESASTAAVKSKHTVTLTENETPNFQTNKENTNHNSKLSSPKGHRSESLKLKVCHLARRGSASFKVKHGFVHQLSELFDKGTPEQERKVVQVKKTFKRHDEIERPQTPKIITPNENIVIYENNNLPDLIDGNRQLNEGSLGFEVTPLQKVTSFEHLAEFENEDKALEKTNADDEYFDYSADENTFEDSDTDSDAELKMYENQMREDEDVFEIYNGDCKGEATLLDDEGNSEGEGTAEFVPAIDTVSETGAQSLKTKTHEAENDILLNHQNKFKSDSMLGRAEEEEIEESIDGDTDSYESEDEEFHDKYYLPGHIYHISDLGHEKPRSQENDARKYADTEKNTEMNELIRPPDQIIIQDAITELSGGQDVVTDMLLPKNEIKFYKGDGPETRIFNSTEEVPARANARLTKDTNNSHETGGLDTHKTEERTRVSSEKSQVDMSKIMSRLPLKSLKAKNQEKTEISQRRNEKPRKPSGYLYDLISRINTHPKSKAQKETDLNERRIEGQKEAEVCLDNSEFKVKIIDKKENSEKHDMMTESKSHLGIIEGMDKERTSIENDKFDLEEHNSDEKSESEVKINADRDYLPRTRHVNDYDEDPQFKIRYPASLSRRLYGPYCRLHSKHEVDDTRETNPPCLSGSFKHTDIYDNLPGVPYDLKVTGSNDSREKVQQSLSDVTSKVRAFDSDLRLSPMTCDLSPTDSTTDNSSIHTDDRSSNPDRFNHTLYAVKTPFSTKTQHGGIKFNLKAINGGERNQAQQKTPLSENNFVNVNLQHEVNEARSDKQESDFETTSHYDNRSYDGKFTKLPMHLECTNLNNDRGQLKRIEINNNNLGVDTNTVAVKNDDHYSTLGVHIPVELPSNEIKQENVDMNNDLPSNSYKVNAVETNIHRINVNTSSVTTQNINSHPMSSGDVVADDKPVNNEDTKSPEAGETRISRASVVLQSPGFQHVLEDEKGKLRIWPYSDFDDSDKVPVTLHRVKKRINLSGVKGMSNRSNSMTVIQSAEHSAEMPENRVVQKYHSSSILPGDRTAGQIMKAHGESVQSVILQDSNGNDVSEEELAAVLPKIANSISKMDNANAEEILPGISQSITKLKNGGNLVITTMTRKLDEDESSSSGRGSPEPEPDYPVLNVDDLENSKIYLVQDSKGELFYVEDVTSETQESAYFSSRNTSESVSDTGNSPIFDRISKINSVGDSGIKQSTAQEILTAMYGDSDVKELTENEEEWSERTYEYDIPRRRDSGSRKDYSKDSFNTSYMVEEPGDTLPKLKSASTKDRYESSYQMSGGAPWVYDGGMSQSYSQMTHGVFPDETNSVSVVSTQNADNSAVKTIERYTIEGEAIDYPAPQPMFIPPMVVQTDIPQYSLVKVDVTPKYKDEGVMAKLEAPKPEEPVERPIYKTVATFTTPQKVPSPKLEEKKKYKIIKSKATEKQEEEQETHMRFDEIDYKFSAENVEYRMRPATTETQYFIKSSSNIQPETQFRSEKRIELGKNSDQKFKSQIQVKDSKPEVYEQSSYSYDQMKSELEQSESNMRVVRGSYLIKNTLDNSDVELNDNINMFDGNFNMYKDNPLYKSDEDLYKRLERERLESSRRQERMQRDLNQDISFETADRFTKSKTVKREPEKPRQSLYELLMSRLSMIDAKDIRQKIDVKHNHEDIYGDPRFIHADGESLQNISGTNDFDTVGEKVDLLLKEGKAFITVKVTAERITPVDLDFNVWRKNQAIVTRTIEVDLLATEHRRRLYYKVMEEPRSGSRAGFHKAGPNETILDSKETLELFTKILGAADGEGDMEDIEVKTRSGRTTRPFTSGMDLLY